MGIDLTQTSRAPFWAICSKAVFCTVLVVLQQLATAQVVVTVSRGTGFDGGDEFFIRNPSSTMVRCLLRWTVHDSAFRGKSGQQDVVENAISRYGAQGQVDQWSYECFVHPEIARREKERADEARREQEQQAAADRRRRQAEDEAKRKVAEEQARARVVREAEAARGTEAAEVNRRLSEGLARDAAVQQEQLQQVLQERDRRAAELSREIAERHRVNRVTQEQAALAREKEARRVTQASSDAAIALLAMARQMDLDSASRRAQESAVCAPLVTQTTAEQVPLDKLRRVLQESEAGGPLLSGVAAVRLLLDLSPSEEYVQAAIRVASRAEREGFRDIAQELRMFADERSSTARLVASMPRRGMTEATAMFDAAAAGRLRPPVDELTDGQQSIRSFFVSATLGLLVNNALGTAALSPRQFLQEAAQQSFGSYQNFVNALANSSNPSAASEALAMRVNCK